MYTDQLVETDTASEPGLAALLATNADTYVAIESFHLSGCKSVGDVLLKGNALYAILADASAKPLSTFDSSRVTAATMSTCSGTSPKVPKQRTEAIIYPTHREFEGRSPS